MLFSEIVYKVDNEFENACLEVQKNFFPNLLYHALKQLLQILQRFETKTNGLMFMCYFDSYV